MLSQQPGQISKIVNQIQETCDYFNHFIFQDPSGGRHQLYVSLSQTTQTNPECQYGQGATILNGGDDFYSAQLQSTSAPGSLSGTATVTSVDGTVYQFTFPSQHAGNGTNFELPSTITDRNGNQMTVTDQGSGAFYLTDTLGRKVLSSNGFGTSGQQVTVQGLGGPYVITWGTANTVFTAESYPIISTDCAGIVSPSGSIPVITNIELPNGQNYAFSYDPTYGLLSKIKYPTGGSVSYTWEMNDNSDLANFVSDT